MNMNPILTRRGMMKKTLSAAGLFVLPSFVPAAVFGKEIPSEQILLGAIGVGTMGMANLSGFLNTPGCRIAAVCDVDANRLEKARQAANLPAASAYQDYRKLLARRDIDAVVIATPDHWHVPISLAAARAAKDIYCEKPLTQTIGQGRELCDTVSRYGSIFQVGSHQRSDRNFRFACELVRNGRIGKIRHVTVEIPSNSRENPVVWTPEPVPSELDYDMWLGPAPQTPYVKQRCHYSFRFISDYSGGQLTNWGSHHLDIVQWALDKDLAGPIRISGRGLFPAEGLFDTATDVQVEYHYEDNVTVFCKTTPQTPTGSILFQGDEGWIQVSREALKTQPGRLAASRTRPDEIHLYRSDDHRRNFLDCIRSRQTPAASVETGHRSATVCHLGNIAMQIGIPLEWDFRAERFTNSQQANRMLSRAVRKEWPADFS